MSDLVRVRLPESGAHATVGAGFAETHSLPVLKQPAVDRRGRALPDKPKTTATEAGSKNTSGSTSAATTKEETK